MNPVSTLTEVSVAELRSILATDPDITLIDVREPFEWAAGHVPDARHLPMSELVARHRELTSAPGPVYVVCQSGSRSVRCAVFLAEQGIPAVNVRGGTGAWAGSGFPIVP